MTTTTTFMPGVPGLVTCETIFWRVGVVLPERFLRTGLGDLRVGLSDRDLDLVCFEVVAGLPEDFELSVRRDLSIC